MEINITEFFYKKCAFDFSASVAEKGIDVGQSTWNAATKAAEDYSYLLPDADAKQAFRDYVRAFGAWELEEINAWSDTELVALLIQLIAGDIREMEALCCDPDTMWDEYQELSSNGVVSGRLGADERDQVYYYIGE